MKYIHHTIPMGEELDFDIFDGLGHISEETGFMHNHDCLELNYVIKGGGDYHIGDQIYTIETGDLFIINNCEYHGAINISKEVLLKVIVFNPDIIWSSNSELDYQYLKTFFEWKDSFKHHIKYYEPMVDTIKHLFFHLEKEWTDKKVGYPLVVKALLLQILAVLYRTYESIDSKSQQILKFQNKYNRIASTIHYIDRYFKENLTLNQLAKMSHMNPNYFSTYFKDVMNITLFSYIKNKRLENACLLLHTTKSPITDIGTAVGFSNISYFNKSFKERFKVSPTKYRMNSTRIANSH